MPQAGVCILTSLISGVSAALILASGTSYTETRSPRGTVHNVMRGQSTYNGCRANSCQIAYLNSVEDFCLWTPSQPATRNTEHTLDAWCMKSVRGARLIPDGTISGARLVVTPEYVQITGVGNLTNINVPADGVASASGEGDRVHGLVFTCAYGQLEQVYDWTSFVSQEQFCFRACNPSATTSTCPRIHDGFGCLENVPGKYDTGAIEHYIGTEVPLTLYQEVLAAPSHYSTRQPSNAQVTRARRAIVSPSGSTSSTLVTSFSYSYPGSHTQNILFTSSTVPTTTDTATTITFPSLPTSTLTTTTSMSSSTPAPSASPMSSSYFYNYTHTHTYRHSRLYSSMSSASVSSLSSRHSFSYSPASLSTAYSPSSFDDSSTTSLASSTPSFTSTLSTYSSDPSTSGTSTPTSTPTSTSSFPYSSDGTSSSLPDPSSAQPSSSIPSSAATPTSSPPPPPTSSLASSQSSDVLTFATSLSSSSVSTTSPAIPSSTFPNSQSQLGSQCPPPSLIAVNAGSIVPSPAPLSLMLTTLMIVISSSVGVLIL